MEAGFFQIMSWLYVYLASYICIYVYTASYVVHCKFDYTCNYYVIYYCVLPYQL